MIDSSEKSLSGIRRGLILAAALALLVAQQTLLPARAAEDAWETAGVSEHQIIIGSCSPQSGLIAERGQQLLIGANSYFNSINDAGGVFGRKIKLSVCDDKYDPEAAISCFNTCLKDKVFIGAFFVGSPPISKYVRMGEASKLPLVGFCTGTPSVYDFNAMRFVVRPGYHDEVAHHIDELWKAGLHKIAVVYQNDAYGAAIRENALRSLKDYGATPVIEASYTRSSQDIDDAFARVKAANPEAVILGATADAFKGFVKKRDEAHWGALMMAFSIDSDYINSLGKQADGVVLTQVVPALDDKLPLVQQYNKLRKKYYPASQPNLTSLEAYINAMVIVEALKNAGHDLTRLHFIRGMEEIHGMDIGAGPNFKIGYSSANHNGLNSKAVYPVIVKNGKLEPLSGDDWKTLVKDAKAAAK